MIYLMEVMFMKLRIFSVIIFSILCSISVRSISCMDGAQAEQSLFDGLGDINDYGEPTELSLYDEDKVLQSYLYNSHAHPVSLGTTMPPSIDGKQALEVKKEDDEEYDLADLEVEKILAAHHASSLAQAPYSPVSPVPAPEIPVAHSSHPHLILASSVSSVTCHESKPATQSMPSSSALHGALSPAPVPTVKEENKSLSGKPRRRVAPTERHDMTTTFFCTQCSQSRELTKIFNADRETLRTALGKIKGILRAALGNVRITCAHLADFDFERLLTDTIVCGKPTPERPSVARKKPKTARKPKAKSAGKAKGMKKKTKEMS